MEIAEIPLLGSSELMQRKQWRRSGSMIKKRRKSRFPGRLSLVCFQTVEVALISAEMATLFFFSLLKIRFHRLYIIMADFKLLSEWSDSLSIMFLCLKKKKKVWHSSKLTSDSTISGKHFNKQKEKI